MDLHQAQQIEKDCLIDLYTPIRFPMVMLRGKGCQVWDTDGREYLDLISGGRATNILGHCHPKVVETVRLQAAKLIHTSNDFYNEPALELAKRLSELSDGMKVYLCNSGTEAMEAAIKLARKHTTSNFSEDKIEIITALNSFHGRTYAAMSATGQPKYQQGFGPLLPGFKHVPFNNLDAMIETINEKTCAVLLEPTQGESGIYPASESYLKGVDALCKKYGALLIFDEIQSGMGRTGTFFAYEHYGVQPDIMTLAKGLAGGIPIGAMLAKEPVASSFVPGNHASTFGGSALPAAAAVATIDTIKTGKLLDRAREMGEYFTEQLLQLQSAQPLIKEVRGRGLMIGVEFNQSIASGVKQACLERGVLIITVGDSILRLLPALVITKEQIDHAMVTLAGAIEEAARMS